MFKVLSVFMISLLLFGCDSMNAERAVLRFAMEQGLKSGCNDETSCINNIEENIDQCLTDNDLDMLIKTPGTKYDDKAIEIGMKTVRCIGKAS